MEISSSIPPPPPPPPVFTLFPRLPQELRLQIWQHALPPPRVIKAQNSARSVSLLAHLRPALLRLRLVNSEAHAVFTAAYTPPRGFNGVPTGTIGSWVDYKRDTFYVSAHEYIYLRAIPDVFLAGADVTIGGTPVTGGKARNVKATQLWRADVRNLALSFRATRDRGRTLSEQYATPEAMQEAVNVLHNVLKTFPNVRPLTLVVHSCMSVGGVEDEAARLIELEEAGEASRWQGSLVMETLMSWLPKRLVEEGIGKDVVYKCLVMTEGGEFFAS